MPFLKLKQGLIMRVERMKVGTDSWVHDGNLFWVDCERFNNIFF